jgi:hypothetical protein
VVLNVDDCHKACAELRQRGVRCDDPATFPGYVTFCSFYDPFGNCYVQSRTGRVACARGQIRRGLDVRLSSIAINDQSSLSRPVLANEPRCCDRNRWTTGGVRSIERLSCTAAVTQLAGPPLRSQDNALSGP